MERDTKGLFKRALAGEIKDFTGVQDPYEEPLNPEFIADTERESPDESAEKIIRNLKKFNLFVLNIFYFLFDRSEFSAQMMAYETLGVCN